MNWSVLIMCLVLMGATAVLGEAPGPGERQQADRLAESLFGADASPEPPFSFVIDGKAFDQVRRSWDVSRVVDALDASRVQTTLAWRDRATGFSVRCVAVRYRDFPTVEWTVTLRNDGPADTPLIENVQALDRAFERGGKTEFLLHHNVGSPSTSEDYRPLETPLPPGAEQKYGAAGGRANSKDMSFFNLDWGTSGIIVAVGWPGQWAASFKRDAATSCRVVAGQERTHFRLHPGEEFRTPLIALQPWEGDWIHAQNVWRSWMIAHNLPKVNGAAPKPILLAASSRAFAEMINANEANQDMFIDRYLEEGIKLDYWWMDAGWYVNQGRWGDVGTWEVDRKRFPNGLRAISEHAKTKGVKTLVWFEPERVAPHSWLADNRPEWLLNSPTSDPAWGKLLNLGNPDAYAWLVERVDSLITSEDIGLYRQDFNIDPLSFWRAADAEDRQGITENRYVVAHLAFWDELRKRHPNMLIDTCASGGRRVDLESLRRAVPMWRSDYAYEPVGEQGQTYGLSMWIPFHGTGTAGKDAGYYGDGKAEVDAYTFWSNVAPSTVLNFDMRAKETNFRALRDLVGLWREAAPNYSGDYYPLTPYSGADDVWVAWQFHRPGANRGMVQAFRRPKSPYTVAEFRLKGLKPEDRYEIRYLGRTDRPVTVAGKDLMQKGLSVTISDCPDAVVIAYRKAAG